MDSLLKEAVEEENSHLITGKYHWSLVDLRRQAASYLNDATNVSAETKEMSSFLMQHSTAIRDNTYSSISTMTKGLKNSKKASITGSLMGNQCHLFLPQVNLTFLKKPNRT